MADSAAIQDIPGDERRFDAGHLAWGILLIAFAIFCSLCVVFGVGLNYFLFQSTVPMQTRLIVGRGTVTWTDATLISQATRTQVDLFSSAVISTDAISQANLTVMDRYHELNIARITIKSGSSFDLDQAARPRFDWSSARYTVLLENVRGEFDVMIPRDLGRETWITFRTPENTIVRLVRPGQYTVRAVGDQVQVINYAGEAQITLGGDNPNYAVPPGQRGTIQLSDRSYAMQPARANWLGGMTFDTTNVLDAGTSGTPNMQVWGCTNLQNELPSGYFALTDVDGIQALRMERGGGANSHGSTSCIQYIVGESGQLGRDVSGYSYLGVRATFRISGHSLSVCGADGSECPLMLRMEYVPMIGGVAKEWIHGFFTRIIAGYDEYPMSCASCTIDHEIVNEGAWYTYESGNLLTLMSEDQRPRSILNFRFYASGHEYDVVVSEMALLVGSANPISPN